MKNCLKIGLIVLFSLFCLHINAQEPTDSLEKISQSKDSLLKEKKDTHLVRKAVIYSAVLPGLGQAYNRKWWKIPLIYGALGTLGYFAVNNHLQHKAHVQEYLNRQENPNYLIPQEFVNLDDQALITVHRQYQNNRDLMIFGLIGVYAINLIDAAVDAHFFYFDIGDDLSLHWQPQFQPQYAGLSLGIKFEATQKFKSKALLFDF